MPGEPGDARGRHPSVIDPGAAVLVVIDLQERFRPVLSGFECIAYACARLIRVFRKLGLPVIVTEQYPKGLGPTVPEVKTALEEGAGAPAAIREKTSFSSYACEGVADELRRLQARSVIVCGIETHVCVNQTVHDLLQAGYSVHVAADAVESRRALDHASALRKMERSGAVLTTAEMATFELLQDARHPKFKEVQELFKSQKTPPPGAPER